MQRRDAIRISLGIPAQLRGPDATVACALIDLSAAGAMLGLLARLPAPPLRLRFELSGEAVDLPVTVWRVPAVNRVAVTFPQAATARLHHLIAIEQRRARAEGRLDVVERRHPSTCPWAERGEIV